jgi:hypothetical protein
MNVPTPIQWVAWALTFHLYPVQRLRINGALLPIPLLYVISRHVEEKILLF